MIKDNKPAYRGAILTPDSKKWDDALRNMKHNRINGNRDHNGHLNRYHKNGLEEVGKIPLINDKDLDAIAFRTPLTVGIKVKTFTDSLGKNTYCNICAYQPQYDLAEREALGDWSLNALITMDITEGKKGLDNKGFIQVNSDNYVFKTGNCICHGYYRWTCNGCTNKDARDNDYSQIEKFKGLLFEVERTFREKTVHDNHYTRFILGLQRILQRSTNDKIIQ
jgi:hypothetical protein